MSDDRHCSEIVTQTDLLRSRIEGADLTLPVPPASVEALQVLPLVATVGFLLVALRATVVIGDPRWAIAAGVYLIPVGLSAAAIAITRPGALVTLDDQLPAVLLAAACAVTLVRRPRRRAAN
ncbi:hypothetical protein [Kitasatospora mediocidica]|uniref:hypothetical protein n=1 Tax=Kitasatospora mediocidica TaxID=58352 RepID=UPI0005610932|nr:hypothetical protein [Kitasatospora mediocidica]